MQPLPMIKRPVKTVVDSASRQMSIGVRVMEKGSDDSVAPTASVMNAETVNLSGFVKEKFFQAETARQPKEQEWMTAYRNFRGIYGDNVEFTDAEQSRIFVKITKTKVIAAFGQINDVLFGTDKFPIGVEPTYRPEGVAEYAHIDPSKEQEAKGPDPAEQLAKAYGWDGDGRDMPAGAMIHDLIGGLSDDPIKSKANWQDGPAQDKTKMIQISPAKEAARKMQKTIWDQLDESNASDVLRKAVFEQVMLGTGIVKGPFNYEKVQHAWEINPDAGEGEPKRTYKPNMKLVPRVSHVSAWDFYPDPSAYNQSEMGWAIQRHRLNENELRDLINRPLFDKEAIAAVIAQGPNYEMRGYENQIRPNDIGNTPKERFEVLEYWGTVDSKLLSTLPDTIIKKLDIDPGIDSVQVNIWVCGNYVLRVVLNPFTPTRIPYFVVPYEIDPYNIWGVGLPENMADSQAMMNGFARMTVDNLRLAGHLVFDVNEDSLVPGQDMRIEPGKIFRRQSGQPGQAIFGIKFPSTAQETLMAFDKFRQFADEETGIPSYSHGATGVSSTTRTASGMSMLMGAAALNIKTVIKNIDEYLLRPLGESYYNWNMQFNDEDLDIRGDLEVRANGTSALMMKEVRSQRLMTLMQVGTNPQIAPFIKWNTVIKELAVTLDIDPEELLADPEQAALYAHIIGKQNSNGQTDGAQPESAGAAPPVAGPNGMAQGANPSDPTGAGGGNIGTGSVPQPGQAGFSANTGGQPR